MRKLILFPLVIGLNLFSVAPLEFKQVTPLDAAEPYHGQVFHSGFLWVGKSRQKLTSHYQLELYDSNAKLVAKTELSHALNTLAPYGKNAVLVAGRQPGSRSSHSIVTWTGQKLSVRTTAHPVEAFVEEATGIPGGPIYLAMIGGETPPPSANPSMDPEGYRTLFTLSPFTGISFLAPKLSNVGLVRQQGNYIFAVERHVIGSGNENLARVDVRTQRASRVFPKADRQGLYHFIFLGDGKSVVASERDAGNVHFIDIERSVVLATINIPDGTPHALAEWGRCLVVGSLESRKVTFVNLATKSPSVVGTWDLSEVSPMLHNIVNLSADPVNASLFVRSTLACNPFTENCDVTKSSVWQVRSVPPAACLAN